MKAIQIEPAYATAYYHLAEVYEAKRLDEEAERNYAKAIELNPRFAEVHIKAGLDTLLSGPLGKAVADYKRLKSGGDVTEETPSVLSTTLPGQQTTPKTTAAEDVTSGEGVINHAPSAPAPPPTIETDLARLGNRALQTEEEPRITEGLPEKIELKMKETVPSLNREPGKTRVADEFAAFKGLDFTAADTLYGTPEVLDETIQRGEETAPYSAATPAMSAYDELEKMITEEKEPAKDTLRYGDYALQLKEISGEEGRVSPE
ncbi:MAG: hypothetical protein AB1546_03785, partial [bacterium]